MFEKNTSKLDIFGSRTITQVTGEDNGRPGPGLSDGGNLQKQEDACQIGAGWTSYFLCLENGCKAYYTHHIF